MKLSALFGCSLCLLAGYLTVGRLTVSAQVTPAPPPAQKGGGRGGNGGGGVGNRGAQKELIYVTLPGSLERSPDQNGNGIVVLDAKNNYNFVKRIPVFDYAASEIPEQIAGVTASPVTQMIYIAARGRLAAIDLRTDKKVWENAYDGQCCERPQVSPDGSFMYVGADLKNFWYVVNPKTGELITKVMAPLSPNTHNLNLSLDGKLAFMSPNGKVMSIADTTTHQLVKTIAFDDNIRVFVLNHDSSLIYTNQNNFLGFQIADVKTGKVLHTVEVQGFPWRDRWFATPRPRIPHGCPSHGIAFTNDEREIWLADGMNDYIHIFDNTVMPPKQIQSIKTTSGPYWITVGLDGNLAYVSSGDIIDMKSRKIIGQMKDEFGRTMYSEKLLDMTFANGKLLRVANQFGNGLTPPAPVTTAKVN
jgi:DNA-binding beta-propeller fold protein YncE